MSVRKQTKLCAMCHKKKALTYNDKPHSYCRPCNRIYQAAYMRERRASQKSSGR